MEGNLEAMRNIQGMAYAFISSYDLHVSPPRTTASFQIKANEVLQKTSVIKAFKAPYKNSTSCYE